MGERRRRTVDWEAVCEHLQDLEPLVSSSLISRTVTPVSGYTIVKGQIDEDSQDGAYGEVFNNYPPRLLYTAVRVGLPANARPDEVAQIVADVAEEFGLKAPGIPQPEDLDELRSQERLGYKLHLDVKRFAI